ncbi:MAG: hypothetical protein L0206_10430, partial [Actinobacteria bacterium]|nr:hypothetical protein [Actinomycetota bacterium]
MGRSAAVGVAGCVVQKCGDCPGIWPPRQGRVRNLEEHALAQRERLHARVAGMPDEVALEPA